jgi:hypothetical protein
MPKSNRNWAYVGLYHVIEDLSSLPWETPHTRTPAEHTDCGYRCSLFSQEQCTLLVTAWRYASSCQLFSVSHSVKKQTILISKTFSEEWLWHNNLGSISPPPTPQLFSYVPQRNVKNIVLLYHLLATFCTVQF